VTNRTKRSETSDVVVHANSKRASSLIQKFAINLRQLAGGGSIPHEWRALVLALVPEENIFHQLARLLQGKPRPKGKPGRKPNRTLKEKQHLVSTIESIKSDLARKSLKRIKYTDAIRHWIKSGEPNINEVELEKWVRVVAKEFSRNRPVIEKRAKKKSQNRRR
jgi:hypothetical protein